MPSNSTDSKQRSSGTNDAHIPETPARRFALIDGLRGLAAVGVVVFHTWWYEPEPRALLVGAEWFEPAFYRARAGVQILLVISGFVIAFTLRSTWVTPREIQSFVVRRIIRLVPAYWVALGFSLLMGLLCLGPLQMARPFDGEVTVGRFVAHLAFLQDVIGFKSLSAGLWTVCIEMQFYVVAVLGWGAAQRILPRPRLDDPRPSPASLVLVFAPLAIVSLVFCYRVESTEPWVIYFLWRFCLGMAVWWTLDGTIPRKVFAAMVAIGVGQLAFELGFDTQFEYDIEFPSANFIGLAAALMIFFAGRSGQINEWLNWTWLQFLGRISYSVYLIHYPVVYVLSRGGWHGCGGSPSRIQAIAISLFSIVASLLAGYVLHVCVEAPSFRWAAKLKRPLGLQIGKPEVNP